MRSPDAIRRLLELRHARFLFPYLGRERSISQAADELSVSIARMSYQTRKLVEVGLLAEASVVKRSGRPVTFYRSVADELLVGIEALGKGDLEGFLLDSEEPMRNVLARSIALSYASADVPARDLFVRLRRLSSGGIDFGPATAAGNEPSLAQGVFTTWTALSLTSEDGRILEEELRELWARWQTRSQRDGGNRIHLLRLATAPVDLAAH